MKRLFRSKIRFVFIPILAIGFLFLISFVVMHLWNYTLPALFGVSAINLWQSMALFFLCKLLFGFGGSGPGRGGPRWRNEAMRRKFDRMDESDRERFRARMRGKWCGWEPADNATHTETDANANNNQNETN